MDVYNKSYYLCNEVTMGLIIFSNYMGNNNAKLIGLIKKIMIWSKCTSHNEIIKSVILIELV